MGNECETGVCILPYHSVRCTMYKRRLLQFWTISNKVVRHREQRSNKKRNNLTEFVYRQWSLILLSCCWVSFLVVLDSHKYVRFRLVCLTWSFLGFNFRKEHADRCPFTQTHANASSRRKKYGKCTFYKICSMVVTCLFSRTVFICRSNTQLGEEKSGSKSMKDLGRIKTFFLNRCVSLSKLGVTQTDL